MIQDQIIFLQSIEQQLRFRLLKNKGNEDLWLRLAENLCQQGKLFDAKDIYEHLNTGTSATVPFFTLLNGKLEYQKVDELAPPVIRLVSDFLSEEHVQVIWKEMHEVNQIFKPARVRDLVNKELRSAKILYEKNFPKSSMILKQSIIDLFNHDDYYLLSGFDVKNSQIHLAQHSDEDFLSLHRDNDGTQSESKRKWTYIYYFNQVPKAFEGGDLLIYNTNPIRHEKSQKYTRVTPQNNQLILFPSDFYHEVCKVKIENPSPFNGRFAMNGWLS